MWGSYLLQVQAASRIRWDPPHYLCKGLLVLHRELESRRKCNNSKMWKTANTANTTWNRMKTQISTMARGHVQLGRLRHRETESSRIHIARLARKKKKIPAVRLQMKTNMHQACTVCNMCTMVAFHIPPHLILKRTIWGMFARDWIWTYVYLTSKSMPFSIAIWQKTGCRSRALREALWNFNIFSFLQITHFMFLGSSWH